MMPQYDGHGYDTKHARMSLANYNGQAFCVYTRSSVTPSTIHENRGLTQVGIYVLSCNEQWKPQPTWYGHAHILKHAERIHPIDGAYKIMPSYVHYTLFVVKFPNRSKWGSRLETDDNGELHIIQTDLRQTKTLVLCTQLSHKNEAYHQAWTITALQANEYTIKKCTTGNTGQAKSSETHTLYQTVKL